MSPNDCPSAPSQPAAPPPGYPYPYAFFPPEEDEVSLLDLIRALRKRRGLIGAITLLGTAVAVAYALLATPIYRARAVIAPPQEKQAGGITAAIGAFGGLGAEIASSMGISLGGADANRLEALLKSHRLIRRVVEKHDLLPILFSDKWDPVTQRWNVADPEDVPNIWDAEKELNDIYRVKNDIKTGTLTVSFDFADTEQAKEILNYFLEELALVVQEDEFRKIEANRRFAQEQLQKATDPVIVSKLQALLSEQVEKAMMAQNVEHFAYDFIDPPAASDQKVKPKRALVVALGFTVSGFLGVFAALFREWTANLAEIDSPESA